MSEFHHLEVKLLRALRGAERMSFEKAKDEAGISGDSVSRAALWLSSKNLLEIDEEKRIKVKLGSEGEKYRETGLPERFLVKSILKNRGECLIDEAGRLSGLSDGEVKIALGWARRKRWIRIQKRDEKPVISVPAEPDKGSDEKLMEALSEGPILLRKLDDELKSGLKTLQTRPNFIVLSERADRFLTLTNEGRKAAGKLPEAVEEVSQLTPELVQSGDWRKAKLRRYNIEAPVAAVWPGKKQPYKRFLDMLREKLVAFGFKEMDGPIVELMFFNCDALYMPQDHPAREIHDIYQIKEPQHGDLSRYSRFVENVKKTHEKGWKTGSTGWGSAFSVEEARTLILRSQGTALSARTLVSDDLEVPGKYFSISRCYRPDVVDRSHLTEFNQIEGIVVGERLSFVDLLGVLHKFAVEVAEADRVRFRPDYFPFTEPSVELSAFKEGYGWVEFGGAGLFRPEVCLPLGVSVPVIAWGLGVDRLFMMKAGIEDIRTLFAQDLEWLRTKEVR
jgi:phenylalanyl-tRNA synthetase alpha chain